MYTDSKRCTTLFTYINAKCSLSLYLSLSLSLSLSLYLSLSLRPALQLSVSSCHVGCPTLSFLSFHSTHNKIAPSTSSFNPVYPTARSPYIVARVVWLGTGFRPFRSGEHVSKLLSAHPSQRWTDGWMDGWMDGGIT
jgi:hypothetical protein